MGIHEPGNMNQDLLFDWVSKLRRNKGRDIFRTKGVFNISGRDEKFVYQGVHMVWDGDFHEPWGVDEPRTNKLTFIGKNLDHKGLQESFMECLDTPDNMIKRFGAPLRFVVGDKVMCNMGSAWCPGVIVKCAYFTGKGLAPYQMKLDEAGGQYDGMLIMARHDNDAVIRAA